MASGRSALSPLDGSEAERIATEFLRARGRLLTSEDARRDALSAALRSSARSRYNDRFHRWDNDCTNFASQCAAAGGLSRVTGFYRSDGAWWHTGMWPTYASFTWSAAHNLYRHLWENKRAAFRKSWDRAVPGDLLFWSYQGNGEVNHVSVINAVRGGIPFYAQHTSAAWNRSIHKGLHGHPNAKVYIAHVTG